MDRKEAIDIIQKNWPYGRHQLSEALQTLIPEFQESDDERMKREILELVSISGNGNQFEEIKDWLEKQGKPRVSMIQWKGDNLREVLEFTGKNKNFDKWFTSFEKFEEYVHEHNDIFKIFNEDGSHYEIPVGAWIIKTPDGYNVPSKARYKQKAVWSEEDEKMFEKIFETIDSHYYVISDYKEMLSWLKSLKERVRAKQEWSEEDEKNLGRCIDVASGYYSLEDKQNIKDWLRNLKSRIALQSQTKSKMEQ